MQGEKGSINFRLFGIPVAIAPSFLVIAAILGAGGSPSMIDIALWGAVVTVSILVHEFGHAIAAKYFGASPSISLMSTGGLTTHGPMDSRLREVLVILAGPGAGFAFIALLTVALMATGKSFALSSAVPWVFWPELEDPTWRKVLYYLAYVNIGWGIVNLFPVLPLDGGQLMQHGMEVVAGEHAPLVTLAISALTGIAVAGLFYLWINSVFMLLVFGYLGAMSGLAFYRVMKHGLKEKD